MKIILIKKVQKMFLESSVKADKNIITYLDIKEC